MKSRVVLYSILLIFVTSFVILIGSLTVFSSTETIEFPGEGTYTGEMKGRLFHGQGKWVSDFGVTYEGDFEKGNFHGFGTMTFAGGASYTGGFKNGLMHGQGVMTFADGHTHEGYWDFNKFFGDHEYCDHDH